MKLSHYYKCLFFVPFLPYFDAAKKCIKKTNIYNSGIVSFLFLAVCLSYLPFVDALIYPNFNENPYLTRRMQCAIAPYLFPLDHPMRATLDALFSQSRVIQDEKTLADAGFTIVAGPMKRSHVIVARHPLIPGYVFKLYLDSEDRLRKGVPHWLSLTRRCVGAQGIRQIIAREKIQHFLVPDKWLYLLPVYPFSNAVNPEPIVLIETDMEPESLETSILMWKTGITREHLDELYCILKHGFGGEGTMSLFVNVPSTQCRKFAFTDTESLKMKLKLKNVKRYLSEEMELYWDSLINPKTRK